MGSGLWWAKMALFAIFSLFFLFFGIGNLVGAFQLANPLEFILYFFSASLMVLVSVVGLLYPCFQVHAYLRAVKSRADES